ncbi:MAG TPA: polyprenol monophosphomannose synthase [Candidatus Paceibacterota bacterium]
MNNYFQSIILIPTLNEKENLKNLIPGIFGLMLDTSVLVVDDNSSDGTQELVRGMQANFKHLFLLERKNNFGYGCSSIDGFKWVFERGYDNVVTMDADFSHDYNDAPSMLEVLGTFDVVVGSRYIKNGGVKNWNFFRRVLSRFANLYVKIILRLPITDTTTGFNAYRVNSLKKINLNAIDSNGYAFLVELKYRLFLAGCSFFEYPILFSERREGQSKMSSKIIWESVKLPWKLRLKN